MAFKDLGIEMDRTEAKKLLSRMDVDGSLNISFDEWRDFLLLAPSTDIHELITYWRHSTVSVHKMGSLRVLRAVVFVVNFTPTMCPVTSPL
jgi:hypothetical protein